MIRILSAILVTTVILGLLVACGGPAASFISPSFHQPEKAGVLFIYNVPGIEGVSEQVRRLFLEEIKTTPYNVVDIEDADEYLKPDETQPVSAPTQYDLDQIAEKYGVDMVFWGKVIRYNGENGFDIALQWTLFDLAAWGPMWEHQFDHVYVGTFDPEAEDFIQTVEKYVKTVTQRIIETLPVE